MVRSPAIAAANFYVWHRRRMHLWLLFLTLAVTVVLSQGLWWSGSVGGTGGVSAVLSPSTLMAILLAAFVCEYLDSSLGMGYGTTLTPVLLIAGFSPMSIVPAVLFSELLTGLAAGLLHHHDGNVDLLGDHRARRTLALLSLLSGVGALAAVLLAVRLSGPWFGFAIVAIVLAMGVLTLVTAGRRIRYRAGGIVAVGLVAAFNKGLSGGGYGPLVTSGQVVSGVPARHAVAITSMAEALTCLVGFCAYLAVKGAPDWGLTLPLAAGALLSVPWATVTVRRLPETWLRAGVGTLTLVLGVVSLIKLVS
jgi:uncharacterized membrane protein YfcA